MRKQIEAMLMAALVGTVLPGIAAEPASQPKPRSPRWLQQLDRDGDGRLSPAERQEARRRMQGSRGRVRPADTSLPEGTKILRDIEYARVGDKPLRLDLYLSPHDDGKAPMAVIVWIHGGGWQAGSKERCPLTSFCGRGYAVVSVDYRLTDVAAFPAQIHDCKAAVRWVRAHAQQYGLDPERLGVAGASAGGHLVALLGTSGGVKEAEGDLGDHLDQSSRVQAVCDFCGPASFIGGESAVGSSKGTRRRGAQVVAKFLGGPISENIEKARLASPVAHVSRDDPPFLIIHGDEDPLVPLRQSELLAEALKKAGVDVTLHVVRGAGHGVVNAETVRLAGEFFDKYLRNTQGTSARKPATRSSS